MVIQRTSGPLKWMSPERFRKMLKFHLTYFNKKNSLRRKIFSTLSDVWSWGITCIEILSEDEPYPGMDLVEVAKLVGAGKLQPDIPPNAPELVRQVLLKTFSFDANLRPFFDTIVEQLKQIK